MLAAFVIEGRGPPQAVVPVMMIGIGNTIRLFVDLDSVESNYTNSHILIQGVPVVYHHVFHR